MQKDNLGKHFKFYADLLDSDLPVSKYRSDETKLYVDMGCGFDIETSIIPETDYSTMVCWQFALDDFTIIGRTWREFTDLLERLNRVYDLNNERRLLVWVHNLKYEFSFIKNQVTWHNRKRKNGLIVPDIFALDKHTIIKATTNTFIEFRDSLALTNCTLEELAKVYNLSSRKLSSWDYNLIRHNTTPLSKKEIDYCINDVQILSQFYHNYIRPNFIKKHIAIPLTSTAIVRAELKRTFKKLPKDIREKHKQLIKKCMPSEKDYNEMIHFLFRGGYNHANALYLDEELICMNMRSKDFKSAYPAVMLQEKFVSRYDDKDPSLFFTYVMDKKWLKNNGFWVRLKLSNIKAKSTLTLESENRMLYYSDDAKFDNGRLVSASNIEVDLTDHDFLNYIDIYTFRVEEVVFLKVGKKEELPYWFKDLVLKYYYLKETLLKDTTEYLLAKKQLNSFYGLCVAALMYDDLRFDSVKGDFVVGDCIHEYNKLMKKQILLPQWGIQISAIARRRLVHSLVKLDNDSIYGDTDSAKYCNSIGNAWIFDTFNDRIHRINKNIYTGKYDRHIFSELGTWSDEGKLFKFKTLGCKRYVNTKVIDGKLVTEASISGMKKGSLYKYCTDHDLDIYDTFKNNLELDDFDSERLASTYIDYKFLAITTDYLGNTEVIEENSCCTLRKVPYSLSMAHSYLRLITGIQELTERKHRYYV